MKITSIIIVLMLYAACNTNPTSIPVNNLHVLYEEDAHLNGPLSEEFWQDIACPFKIDKSGPETDTSNCACMQKDGWVKIDSLWDIKLHNPSFKNVNIVWVKGEFDIGSPEQYYAVYLKHVQGRDITYINNHLMGIKKATCYHERQMPSNYVIPAGALLKGENAVLMRLEIVSQRIGGVSPDILIQRKSDYDETRFWHTVFYLVIGPVLYYLIIALFIISLIQIFRDNTQRIPVILALFLLTHILLGATVFIPYNFLNVFFIYLLPVFSHYVYVLLMIFFIQALYEIRLGWENKIAAIIIIFSIWLIDRVKFSFVQNRIDCIMLIFVMILCFACMLFVLYKVNKSKPNKLQFSLLLIIIIIFNTYWIWMTVLHVKPVSFWPNYTAPFLNIGYSLSLFILGNAKINKKRKELENRYNKVIEQMDRQPAVVTITGSSEEKLAYVMDFINKNYTEDISRESLAASIDMNPNYLSTLFNAYTGRKFQEYINRMRVKKAAEMIQDTNEKIGDIANSVGFQDISTFIRAFKKETGKTPKEYREEKNHKI